MKRFSFSGRAAVVTALILAIGVPATAVGFGEGRTLLLGKRNPSHSAASAETEIIANNTTYGTRQSNLRNGDGGGAIYGCRSNPGTEPCVRANNLKTGRAFEFVTKGNEAGRIETGNAAGAPFTTNATGVATGLNADKVDGKDATDFAAAADLKAQADRLTFALVSDSGSGTPTASGPGNPAVTVTAAAPFVYTVDLKRDVSKCSYTASPAGPSGTAPGVSGVSGQANQVAVNLGAARGSFHLQVIC
jgi:hypothetical protein